MSRTTFLEVDLVKAHRQSHHNQGELSRSQLCGCFRCLTTFEFKAIVKWADKGQTALCPRCGMDSVLGDASGHPIAPDFLNAMRQRFFVSPWD